MGLGAGDKGTFQNILTFVKESNPNVAAVGTAMDHSEDRPVVICEALLTLFKITTCFFFTEEERHTKKNSHRKPVIDTITICLNNQLRRYFTVVGRNGEKFGTVDLDNAASLAAMAKIPGVKVVSDEGYEKEFHKKKFRFDTPKDDRSPGTEF